MVARSRGGGRFIRSSQRDSSGRKTNPYRPATGKQQDVPAGIAIAERGHRGVPGLGGTPKNEPAGDPINQALGPSIRSMQGGQRQNSNDHRFASIEFRLGSTPQIHDRKLAHCGGMPVTEPTSDLGSCVGPIESRLPPRAASERGEMDQDQDGDGRLSMDCLSVYIAPHIGRAT